MTPTTRLLLVGLGLSLILAIAIWFHRNFEQKEMVVTTGPASEARRNPLLAAERYLQALGYPATSTTGDRLLLKPPPSGDTLLLYRNRKPFTATQQKTIYQWLEDGGHLIMDVSGLWDRHSKRVRAPLLDELGVRVVENSSRSDFSRVAFAEPENDTVEIGIDDQYRLFDSRNSATGWAGDTRGAVLLQFDIGNGMLTLLSDQGFIDNEHIEQYDNAYYLALLLDRERRTWLLFNPQTQTLAQLIYDQAKPFLAALLLLAIFWIWSGNQRFGPLQSTPLNVRRNVTDHLDAQGRFLWRHHRQADMLRATRQEVERRWCLRHPQLRLLNDDQRSQWIADKSQIAATRVRQALYAEVRRAEDVTRISALLRTLLNSI